jgi:DnaJ-class molecular chaperone
MDEQKAMPAEIEGDPHSWWYVCGACHGAIDYMQTPCPHCKRPVIWK